jgi:hypothetical protein
MWNTVLRIPFLSYLKDKNTILIFYFTLEKNNFVFNVGTPGIGSRVLMLPLIRIHFVNVFYH